MKKLQANNENLKEIITALENGAVLVLPTDTVYGLVCDASNNTAVENIFEIKKRDKSKPLPVFVKDLKMAESLAEINKDQEKIIKENWPGAVTYVLPAKSQKLSPLVYKEGTIALRQPNYPLIQDIFKKFKKPLAQTSANISDAGVTTKISEVISQLGDQDIILVAMGDLPVAEPSTIIDLSKGEIKKIR